MESIDHYISKQTQLVEYTAKIQKARRELIFFNVIPVFIILAIVMYLISLTGDIRYNPDGVTFWLFLWNVLLFILRLMGMIIAVSIVASLSTIISKKTINKNTGTFTYIIALGVQIIGSYFMIYNKNDMFYQPWIYFLITSSSALIGYGIFRLRLNIEEYSLTFFTVVAIPNLGGFIIMGAIYQTSLGYSIFLLVLFLVFLMIVAAFGL